MGPLSNSNTSSTFTLSPLPRVKPPLLVKLSDAAILVPFDNTDVLLNNVETLPVAFGGENADRVLVVKPVLLVVKPVCPLRPPAGVLPAEILSCTLAGVKADRLLAVRLVTPVAMGCLAGCTVLVLAVRLVTPVAIGCLAGCTVLVLVIDPVKEEPQVFPGAVTGLV